MFTGIVEELGEVLAVERLADAARLHVRAPALAPDLVPGDSVAVDGVCLTVAGIAPAAFTADVMRETLQRSTLGTAAAGTRVNLERAARLDSRLGGHLVQGHVDDTGAVIGRTSSSHWDAVRIALPRHLAQYVVEKGSIAVDGVSLTVAAVDGGAFDVSLIPTTLARTTLGTKQVGAAVNLEVDVLAKYVERLLEGTVMTGPAEYSPMRFDPIERAIADIRAGRAVVVVDDKDRENEGDLVFAAARATPQLLAFTIKHTSGVVCVPMQGRDLDRLKLPPMTAVNEDRKGTAYTVSVDARDGVTTGISAADRAHTIRVLVDSATEPYELTRPGHVFPLRALDAGVLRRPGHTEAAVDLARLAGLTPAGVLSEIVNDDGTMARLPELVTFARRNGLALVSIADLIAYRRRTEKHVVRVVETRLPTEHGTWRAIGYRNTVDGSEHMALVFGDIGDGSAVLVRAHSECLTGDVFGSRRCDCGPQLAAAMERIAGEGRGVVLYLRGHEGRGIGLMHKLQAYHLQDLGADTVDANLELGLPPDARDYGTGAQVLADLGVRSMRLLTNNPAKHAGLEGFGLTVIGRESLPTRPTPDNLRYLRTKRDRMGHDLPHLDHGSVPEGSPP